MGGKSMGKDYGRKKWTHEVDMVRRGLGQDWDLDQ